ncbi:hypothetical protein INT47_010029 [Mucor saturninus]|uniref:Uncharacterized protein n=1 Tax=Mucor saturninus TaxID=64648 RepID=A0A8H7UZ70_9FUNG|nr:hypothetical protein INT47_010029 [Mucor saturninus]
MAKINGVSTFSCLYTVLNEYEEIRLQALAPTKSLDHLTPSFNIMILFLESAIPSLLENVIHVKPTISERIDTTISSKTVLWPHCLQM